MKDLIGDNWRRVGPGQQIVAAVVFLIVAYLCFFFLSYACAWLVVLLWVLNLP